MPRRHIDNFLKMKPCAIEFTTLNNEAKVNVRSEGSKSNRIRGLKIIPFDSSVQAAACNDRIRGTPSPNMH